MRTETADYGYTIEQAGDGVVVAYQQKPRPWQVALGTLLLIVPCWLLSFEVVQLAGLAFPMLAEIREFRALIVVVSTIFLSYNVARGLVRAIDARRPRPAIRIRPDSLEANGKRYERRHIRQIYAQAPNTVQNNQPAMADNSGVVAIGASGILGGSGVAIAGLQAGADGIRNSVGLVSHGVLGSFNVWKRARGSSIWMLYGAKPVRIASRLQPAHADLLADDLVRLLTAR